jgi:hypothetical protein
MAAFFCILVVLGIPALVILAPSWLRARERHRILQALTAASDRGTVLPPEHIAALLAGVHQVQRAMRPVRPLQPDHVRDARRGIVLVAFALSLMLIGLAASRLVAAGGAQQWAWPTFFLIASIGAIPGMIGLAYVLLSRYARRSGLRGLDAGDPGAS